MEEDTMKNLKNKMKKSGGFTLIEMLIVVAIIAILIAISIPMVSSALNKAKKATDAANERAAKAEGMIMLLSDEYPADVTAGTDGVYTLYYDADAGTLISDEPDVKYGKCKNHDGDYLTVSINPTTNTVTVAWNNSKALDGSVSGIIPETESSGQ
jgi:type IV pilus assembly protein PilA